MKKLLLSAVAVLGLLPGLTSTASADTTAYVAEDRSGWVISGCSNETGEGDKLGKLNAMKDGNVNTYWHTTWSAESHHSANHYFVVDRGEALAQTALSAVGYTPRQGGGGNGYVQECDIYILDSVEDLNLWTNSEIAGVCDGGHNIDSFISELTPTAHGSFSYQHSSGSYDESKVAFEEPIAGRYILFVATKTNGDSNNQSYGNVFCNCAEFNAYTVSATPYYSITLTVDCGVETAVINLGSVEEGTTYTMPTADASVLTITGWNNGDAVTADVNLQGTLAEGVKPFKLNNIRFSNQWATTNETGLLRAATTYDAGEFFVEVPVADSSNFKIYSLNQLKWVGAAGTNVAQVEFAETAGEFQLLKHSSGVEAIGNAGAASSAQVFFNSRNNGIGTWSAGNDAGSHWAMVYDNTSYQENLTAAAIVVDGANGNITGSTFATALAAAEAKYNAVADVADDVIEGFGAQKAALENAIDAARAARLGVAGVNFAQIIEDLNTTTAAINENVETVAAGLKVLANGNAFAALGIASEDGVAKWQEVVEIANAKEPSAITESDVESLTTAYETLVATSANTPGGAYVTFEHPLVAGDMMCVRYGNGAYVGRYGNDVNGNKTTWKIVTAEGGFKLYNAYSAKYLKMPTADNQNTPLVDEAEASVFVLDVFNAEEALYGVKYAGADVTSGREYLHSNNGHNVVRWEKGRNSAWYLALSSADIAAVENAQGATDQLADAIANCAVDEEKVGEGWGYFSVSQEYREAKAAANAAAEGEDAAAKRAAAVALFAAYPNAFTLNGPVAGDFLRFSYDFNEVAYYVQGVASGVSTKENAMKMTEETGAESIFYFDGSSLLSYSAGTYVKETDSTRGLMAVGAAGGDVTFGGGGELGTFTIQAPSFMHANTADEVHFIDHCGGVDTTGPHDFDVEVVTTLPLTIGDDLYATFAAPVAVIIPESVTVYRAHQINGGGLEIYKISGTIPANTPVIVKAEAAGTYEFSIETAEAVALAEAVATPVLATTTAAIVVPEGAYTLQIKEGEAGMYPAEANAVVSSFSAYMPAEVAAGAEGYTLKEVNDPTGIEEIEAADSNVRSGIYDLQGRRLSAPVKGINIINGKKVLVK